MKISERKSCLAAVLLLTAGSAAVAATIPLFPEQDGKEQNSTQSLNKKIIGEWDVALDKGDGYVGDHDGNVVPVLIVEADGDHFTGKVYTPGGRGIATALIEPRFEGEKFIIKAIPGEGQVIEGYVILTKNDRWEGEWKHTVRNGEGASGKWKLVRRD